MLMSVILNGAGSTWAANGMCCRANTQVISWVFEQIKSS